MPEPTNVYRIRDWDQQFETRGSRQHHRPFTKINLATAMDGLALRRLLSDADGATAYGVWVLLLQVAAKAPRRGILADERGAYTSADLALLTGVPEAQVQTALELLSSARIGLLERIPMEIEAAQQTPDERSAEELVPRNTMTAQPASALAVVSADATIPQSVPGIRPPPSAAHLNRYAHRSSTADLTGAELQRLQHHPPVPTAAGSQSGLRTCLS